MTTLTVTYARQTLPTDGEPSIFLVGPTPRGERGTSWRPAVIAELEAQGFTGNVYSPEQEPDSDGVVRFRGDYFDQVQWEHDALAAATVILAYVPRNLQTMPALTTNVEWGMWFDSGKIVLGSPTEAEANRYLEWTAHHVGAPVATSIEGVVADALTLLAKRLGQVDECIFCRIATLDPRGQVLHRNARSVVIEPLNPVTPGHRLVIPTHHVDSAITDPAVTGEAMKDAAEYAATLGMDCNIITSVGEAATQTVHHLHIHVVPRTATDGLHLPWTGQVTDKDDATPDRRAQPDLPSWRAYPEREYTGYAGTQHWGDSDR